MVLEFSLENLELEVNIKYTQELNQLKNKLELI